MSNVILKSTILKIETELNYFDELGSIILTL